MKKNMLLKLAVLASVVTLVTAVNFKEVKAEDKMKSAKEVVSEMVTGLQRKQKELQKTLKQLGKILLLLRQ